tara:strand:+ start:1230 stop:1778 length:549 start_codon:yes stop_codon:yes gene_type:complete
MRNHFDKGLNVSKLVHDYGCKTLLELGAAEGQNTQQLVTLPINHITVVSDQTLKKADIQFTPDERFEWVEGIAHEVVPTLTRAYDFVIIDTDHNGWTVAQELAALEKVLPNGAIVCFHDTVAFEVDGIGEKYRNGALYPLEEIKAFPTHYTAYIKQWASNHTTVAESLEWFGALAVQFRSAQ